MVAKGGIRGGLEGWSKGKIIKDGTRGQNWGERRKRWGKA